MSDTSLPMAGAETSSGSDSTEAILESVYAAEGGNKTETSSQDPNASGQAPTDFDVEFTWKGKPVKQPWSKAKSFVQKGYDYEQNISALKREREEFDRQRNTFGDPERLKELKQLDDYSRQNPQFLEDVKTAFQRYQSGQTGQGAQPSPVDPNLQPFVQKLTQMEQTISSLMKERETAVLNQAGSQLDTDLKSLREQHTYFDWDSEDNFGYNREHRVLKYIQDHGVDAKKAFWSLYGEEIAAKKEELAINKVQSDIQEKHRKGRFIGQALSKGSSFTPPANKNITNSSYDDLGKLAMKDFNLNY
jgi:parvulin-like peptidyl-prolyl isomerase